MPENPLCSVKLPQEMYVRFIFKLDIYWLIFNISYVFVLSFFKLIMLFSDSFQI